MGNLGLFSAAVCKLHANEPIFLPVPAARSNHVLEAQSQPSILSGSQQEAPSPEAALSRGGLCYLVNRRDGPLGQTVLIPALQRTTRV